MKSKLLQPGKNGNGFKGFSSNKDNVSDFKDIQCNLDTSTPSSFFL